MVFSVCWWSRLSSHSFLHESWRWDRVATKHLMCGRSTDSSLLTYGDSSHTTSVLSKWAVALLCSFNSKPSVLIPQLSAGPERIDDSHLNTYLPMWICGSWHRGDLGWPLRFKQSTRLSKMVHQAQGFQRAIQVPWPFLVPRGALNLSFHAHLSDRVSKLRKSPVCRATASRTECERPRATWVQHGTASCATTSRKSRWTMQHAVLRSSSTVPFKRFCVRDTTRMHFRFCSYYLFDWSAMWS